MTSKQRILWAIGAWALLAIVGLALAYIGNIGSAVCCGLMILPASVILSEL